MVVYATPLPSPAPVGPCRWEMLAGQRLVCPLAAHCFPAY
jgi:hypothetical protein